MRQPQSIARQSLDRWRKGRLVRDTQVSKHRSLTKVKETARPMAAAADIDFRQKRAQERLLFYCSGADKRRHASAGRARRCPARVRVAFSARLPARPI